MPFMNSFCFQLIMIAFYFHIHICFTLLYCSWEVHRTLDIPRCHHILTSIHDNLFLIGGISLPSKNDEDDWQKPPKTISLVQCYDEKSDNWIAKEELPEPLHDAYCSTKGKFQIGSYSHKGMFGNYES